MISETLGTVRNFLRGLDFLISSEKSHSFPSVENIEITNRCNLKCSICARPHGMSRKTGDMELNLFKRILNEIPPSHRPNRAINFTGFGEPLLHPHVDEMINYASERDSNPMLHIFLLIGLRPSRVWRKLREKLPK